MTRTTVVVGGIVGTDPLSAGADIGAQARFARANRVKELGKRSVQYLRTEPVADAVAADAAAARLAGEAFAVVPAVGPSVGASVLAREGVPFFGVAGTVEWYANRTGFGFTGVAVTERTRLAESPLGTQLRAALGGTAAAVLVLHDGDPAGVVRAGTDTEVAARAPGSATSRSLRCRCRLRAFDVTGVAARPGTSVNVFLTSAARTVELVGRLVGVGSTATMVVGPEFYTPTAPAAASGLTVLTAVAPFEEATAANRRLAADVEAFAAGTALTPAIAAGYWSADLFLRGLRATDGRTPTRKGLLDAMNGDQFTFSVAGDGRTIDVAGDAHPARPLRFARAERRHRLRGRRAVRMCPRRDGAERTGDAIGSVVVEPEADLHRHLEPPDLAVAHGTADVGDLEPVEVPERLRRPARCHCGSRRRHRCSTTRRSR